MKSIFIFVFLVVSNQLNSSVLLMIHGTSCAGKSTLTKELAKQYPEFVIMRDYDLISSKRLDLLKKLTGKSPENSRERTELVLQLKPEQRKEYHSQKRFAIRETNQKVKNLLEQGESVIYDASALYTEDVGFFNDEQKIMILVYAPLQVALERSNLRKRKYIRNEVIQQRTFGTILSGFTLLYRPVLDERDSLGILTRNEFDLLLAIERVAFPRFDIAVNQAICHFNLDRADSCRITPKYDYDVVINSTKLTPQKSAEKVIQKLHLIN